MKTQQHIKNVGSLLIAAAFLGLTSCRTSDTENNLAQGTKAQVNINFMGTAFKDEGLTPQASLKSISTGSQKEQSHSVMLTPSSVLTATLSPVKSGSSAQAGIKNSMAVVTGNPLSNGAKFRVIAYKTGDGSYQTYQDYTIGQPVLPLTLDTGVAYTIVAYSYGTSGLPPITPGETSTIGSAQIAYDNISRDLMYVKQAYTPSSSNTTLNLTLMHQLMQITTSVTTNIGTLNNVINAVLTPNYSNGTFALNTGVMSGRTTPANQSIVFNQNDFPVAVNTTVSAPSVLVNSSTTGNGASFSADLNIGGTTKTVNLANSFDITPGTQAVLGVQISKCGAWMDAAHTQWKEFMCQNLGATAGINPFSPVAGNHGHKYQWGSWTGQGGRFVDQATDQSNSGAIPGWNGNTIINDTWLDGTKTANDPCPDKYRVPTLAQWQAVIAYNTNLESVGTWSNSASNFTAAVYIGTAFYPRTLMFPATGSRMTDRGFLENRGYQGVYWSSTQGAGPNNTGDGAYSFISSNNSISIYQFDHRSNAASVRCIAQ